MCEKCPEKSQGDEPEAMLDGLPMAAWLAAVDGESDPARLRAMLRQMHARLMEMHEAVEKQGGRAPKWRQPSKSIRKNPK